MELIYVQPDQKLTRLITPEAATDLLKPITEAEIAKEVAEYQLELNKRANSGKPKRYISLSELTEVCPASIAMRFFPGVYPPLDPVDPALRQQWDKGNSVARILHSRMERALVQSGLIQIRPSGQLAKEVWLSDLVDSDTKALMELLGITGKAGDCLTSAGLTEIKTLANKDMAGKWFSTKLKMEQSQMTMALLGVTEMRYIVINRDAALDGYLRLENIVEYRMLLDTKVVEQIKEFAKLIITAVRNREIPEAVPSGLCDFCQVLHHCKAGQERPNRKRSVAV